MRKYIALLLMATMLLTLTACNGKTAYVSTSQIIIFNSAADYKEYADASKLSKEKADIVLNKLYVNKKTNAIPVGTEFEVTEKNDNYYIVKLSTDREGVIMAEQFKECAKKK